MEETEHPYFTAHAEAARLERERRYGRISPETYARRVREAVDRALASLPDGGMRSAVERLAERAEECLTPAGRVRERIRQEGT